MKFIKKIIHLLKVPNYSPPIEYELTDKEKLIDLMENYELLKKIKNEIVKDKKTKKKMEFSLSVMEDKIIKLAYGL